MQLDGNIWGLTPPAECEPLSSNGLDVARSPVRVATLRGHPRTIRPLGRATNGVGTDDANAIAPGYYASSLGRRSPFP